MVLETAPPQQMSAGGAHPSPAHSAKTSKDAAQLFGAALPLSAIQSTVDKLTLKVKQGYQLTTLNFNNTQPYLIIVVAFRKNMSLLAESNQSHQ